VASASPLSEKVETVRQLEKSGIAAVVMYSLFEEQSIHESLEIVPNLVLSTSQELRMPLRWIALLYGHIQADFALTTGIHTTEDVLKAMMAGANVAMMASELLKNGPARTTEILAELESWMTEHDYDSIKQMQGSMSAQAMREPHALRRSNYIKMLNSFKYLP